MIRLPRKKKGCDEAEGSANDVHDDELGHFKSPMEFYVSQLGNVLGDRYTFATVDIASCMPLPEERARVWILGSRDPGFSAEVWKAKVLLPRASTAAGAEQCCLEAHFKKYGSDKAPGKLKEQDPWHQEASYATAFANAVQKAMNSKKLPRKCTVPDRAARTSATIPALSSLSPWLMANIDVYGMILDHLSKQAEAAGLARESLYCVADVSQSTNRGRCTVCGTWGTVTTSSSLLSYKDKKFLSGKGLLSVLGFLLLGLIHSELFGMLVVKPVNDNSKKQ